MEEKLVNNKLYLEKELLAPYTHIMQDKGKELHVKTCLSFNHWLRIPEDKLHYIVEMVKILENATLLLDDVQDDTEVRRGLAAAHCVYGVPLTINTSLHVICLSITRLFDMPPVAFKLYIENFLEVIRGQGIEIYWRDNFVCPTEEQYNKMVEQKTARMFLLAVSLMQLYSENKTDLSKFVLLFGRYYQIRDDYCNLTRQEVNNENTFCEDLTEGKFSLPIIHAMNTPARDEVLNILRQRTRDINLKQHCISLLEKFGSLKYTRDTLSELDRALREEMARLGGNPEIEAILDNLLNWKAEGDTIS